MFPGFAHLKAIPRERLLLDVWLVIVFGFVGYFCKHVGLDTGAMALGIILGPMIEENLGKCVYLSKASGGSVLQVFLDSPVAIVLIILTALSLLTPLLLNMKRKMQPSLHGGGGHA